MKTSVKAWQSVSWSRMKSSIVSSTRQCVSLLSSLYLSNTRYSARILYLFMFSSEEINSSKSARASKHFVLALSASTLFVRAFSTIDLNLINYLLYSTKKNLNFSILSKMVCSISLPESWLKHCLNLFSASPPVDVSLISF